MYLNKKGMNMNTSFEVSINLSLLPLPLRNKYMLVVRKMNIRFNLENQILSVFEKDLLELIQKVKQS